MKPGGRGRALAQVRRLKNYLYNLQARPGFPLQRMGGCNLEMYKVIPVSKNNVVIN